LRFEQRAERQRVTVRQLMICVRIAEVLLTVVSI